MSTAPSDADLRSIASLVKAQYKKALEAGDAFFYPSEKICILRDSDKSKVIKDDKEQEVETTTRVDWQIRTVPALLKKPTPNANKDQASETEEKEHGKPEQNKSDVFAPPYVPNLLVKDLGDHVILLNKFCVVPQHFLMVTKEFESQNLPPSPATLALAYRIVSAHRSGETELLSFYNCGQISGASQPHRHLQFIQAPPLDTDGDHADEILESDHKVPIEALLERIEQDGKEGDHIHALPLPWQHFVALLQPTKEIRFDPTKLEAYVGNKFMSLLDSLFRARMFATHAAQEAGTLDEDEAKRLRGPPGYNVLLTKRAMHLIPRSREEFEDLLKDKEGKVGNLSINSLGFAGFMLTRSLEELEALRGVEGGVPTVLAKVGVKPVEDVTVASGLPTTTVI